MTFVLALLYVIAFVLLIAHLCLAFFFLELYIKSDHYPLEETLILLSPAFLLYFHIQFWIWLI